MFGTFVSWLLGGPMRRPEPESHSVTLLIIPKDWDPDRADRPMFGEYASEYRKFGAADVRVLLDRVAGRYGESWRIVRSANAHLPPVGFLEYSWYGRDATDERVLAWWLLYLNEGVGRERMMLDGWLSGIDYGDC